MRHALLFSWDSLVLAMLDTLATESTALVRRPKTKQQKITKTNYARSLQLAIDSQLFSIVLQTSMSV